MVSIHADIAGPISAGAPVSIHAALNQRGERFHCFRDRVIVSVSIHAALNQRGERISNAILVLLH
jgi:hypothetical protein